MRLSVASCHVSLAERRQLLPLSVWVELRQLGMPRIGRNHRSHPHYLMCRRIVCVDQLQSPWASASEHPCCYPSFAGGAPNNGGKYVDACPVNASDSPAHRAEYPITDINAPRVRATHSSDDVPLLPHGGYLGALPYGPLVGRTEELTRLIEALDATHQGRGQLFMLLGEPGVGKTRLAQEVSVRATERGFLVLVGRCYEERASLPMYPFIQALSAALQTVTRQFGQQAAARLTEVEALVTRTSSGSTAVARLGSSVEARLDLFSTIAAFIRELSMETPIALLLDDVHWADSASIGPSIHLTRDLAANRVLLLATFVTPKWDVSIHSRRRFVISPASAL